MLGGSGLEKKLNRYEEKTGEKRKSKREGPRSDEGVDDEHETERASVRTLEIEGRARDVNFSRSEHFFRFQKSSSRL